MPNESIVSTNEIINRVEKEINLMINHNRIINGKRIGRRVNLKSIF